jgi:hypothetical protein
MGNERNRAAAINRLTISKSYITLLLKIDPNMSDIEKKVELNKVGTHAPKSSMDLLLAQDIPSLNMRVTRLGKSTNIFDISDTINR